MKFKVLIINFLFFSGIMLSGSPHALAQARPDVWEVLRSEFMINHEVSRPEVQEQIRWLTAHPGYLHKVSRDAEPYIYHIVTQIKKRRLPGELALLPIIESAFNPFAYSSAGAAGLWQLMPKTASGLGLKQDWWFDGRRSVGGSTQAALSYLVYLNNFFNGNWTLAIASYDAGEGTISRAVKASNNQAYFWNLVIPQETKIYVPRLLALAEIIQNPERYHINLPAIPYLPYFEEVTIGSQIDLSQAAKLAGISYKELIKLNPGYNRWTTAPYEPFKLLIPAEKVDQFNFNLSQVPEEKRVSWTKHHVQQGDSLDNIAVRYHTTVNLIKQVNQLTSDYLHLNQSILIPSSKNTTIVARAPITFSPPSLFKPLTVARNHRLIHIVQANDNYANIQKMYGVTAREIQVWNKLLTLQPLRPGQQLVIWKKIKKAEPYIVKPGDTLNLIAKSHQTKVSTIVDLNPGMDLYTSLRSGQRILVS